MNQTASTPILSSHKILGRHFERLAVVYVRQSSLHQVQQNQESTQMQYGLANTAGRLGWARVVISRQMGPRSARKRGPPGEERFCQRSFVATEGGRSPTGVATNREHFTGTSRFFSFLSFHRLAEAVTFAVHLEDVAAMG